MVIADATEQATAEGYEKIIPGPSRAATFVGKAGKPTIAERDSYLPMTPGASKQATMAASADGLSDYLACCSDDLTIDGSVRTEPSGYEQVKPVSRQALVARSQSIKSSYLPMQFGTANRTTDFPLLNESPSTCVLPWLRVLVL
jgi:hypothetical protein